MSGLLDLLGLGAGSNVLMRAILWILGKAGALSLANLSPDAIRAALRTALDKAAELAAATPAAWDDAVIRTVRWLIDADAAWSFLIEIIFQAHAPARAEASMSMTDLVSSLADVHADATA